MTSGEPQVLEFEQIVDRARTLAGSEMRRILGITGAPGAGKSTLAEALVEALGSELAVLVPMDGFHLAQRALEDLGRTETKGAPDTFDGWGYAALLHRIRAQRSSGDGVIYAPAFHRDLEEPVGSEIPVHAAIPLVVTEGNYLLLDGDEWDRARAALDEVWYLAPTEEQRLQQLIERHQRFGRSRDEAVERSLGTDQRNAELIAQTAVRADLLLRIGDG